MEDQLGLRVRQGFRGNAALVANAQVAVNAIQPSKSEAQKRGIQPEEARPVHAMETLALRVAGLSRSFTVPSVRSSGRVGLNIPHEDHLWGGDEEGKERACFPAFLALVQGWRESWLGGTAGWGCSSAASRLGGTECDFSSTRELSATMGNCPFPLLSAMET